MAADATAARTNVAYARDLHNYARHRLDDFSLHCWIVQRLMLDEGLDHETAEVAFARLLDELRDEGCRGRGRHTGSGRGLARSVRHRHARPARARHALR